MSSENGSFAVDPERAAEDNSALLIGVVCAVWSLAFVTALVRFYTRAVVSRSFGRDDVFMALAVLCGIGGLASWVVGCHNGYGRHMDTIPPERFLTLIEAQFYQSIVEASFAFGFLKISIALSLLRFSRGNWYTKILWLLIGFTCFYTLFAFVTFLAYCKPIAGLWNPALRPRCYSRVVYRNFGLFNAGESFFQHPAPSLTNLMVVSMQHLHRYQFRHSAGAPDMESAAPETSQDISDRHLDSVQLDIGIIAACAPTLRPLLGRAPKLSTTLDPYRGANYYRAGKALDRLPLSGNSTRRYLRQSTASGQFFEMNTGNRLWIAPERKVSVFSASAVHAEHARVNGEASGEGLEASVILPPRAAEIRGIVKTTEVRVEE
ncbi:hypothetical protein L209DRAFT_687764 [Thermothelomyces heterothallicus CBS 203.75]